VDPGFWARFVMAALAAWRITHLLAREDGPGDVIVKLRTRLGDGALGGLMDCFHCLSIWVAAPLALLVARTPADRLLAWLALSGAACLLERLGQEPVVFQPLPGTEGADEDGMLRTAEIGAAAGRGEGGDGADRFAPDAGARGTGALDGGGDAGTGSPGDPGAADPGRRARGTP
jgi:hypothetical protein